MYDLYFWPTPNGLKISIALEELGVPYTVHPINISQREQFAPAFLAISPNNRIPALVDHDPADGGAPISIFESGAILQYLGEKYGRFLPADVRGRASVMQWLFWQMAGLGPMTGQAGHFVRYAPEPVPYAIERYRDETRRLWGVLNRQLAGRDYIAGDYSIADMAYFPWMRTPELIGLDVEEFTRVNRWREAVSARPAVARGLAVTGQA